MSDAALIVDVADPVGDLVSAAHASVRAVIATTPHDALIGGAGECAVDSEAVLC